MAAGVGTAIGYRDVSQRRANFAENHQIGEPVSGQMLPASTTF